MTRLLIGAALGVTLIAGGMAGAALAAESADGTKAACKTAEINPVTGHVFCIDPLGASVETPPDSIKPKCEAQSRGQWTWAPNCTPDPEGAQG